jgi:hypothetical protein
MNDIYDPKLTRAEYVSLREYIECKIEAIESMMNESRRLMENRMEGFPSQFALKSEANVFLATNKEIKDKLDLLLSRREYEVQHQILVDKIDAMESRVKDTELLRSNINGRLWALGVGGAVLIAVFEFIIHYVLKIHV